MDKGYEKEGFDGLRIKSSVAQKFRVFCREQGKSQSMNLLNMIDFFNGYGIKPTDTLESHLGKVESSIKKRINSLVAIIRDIEKHQTAPTYEMLQLLFQEAAGSSEKSNSNNETIAGRKVLDQPPISFEKHEAILEKMKKAPIDGYTHYKNQYFDTQQKLLELQYLLSDSLEVSTYVSPAFGKGYVRLDITKANYKELKDKSHVSDHNTPEDGK
ncbi:BfmA/BtgA family mobilization protein [Aestuariibaculum sp. M13]|uniref:BfmA/BtgA family mobilization protein n=1 Tax=Aestuariibaculum sp. M13 TaxID=2967132 RepID=UPI00280BB2BD|nr:BfmA/BtgA family mobilization protein [Aestuariibaculum sp. M13]